MPIINRIVQFHDEIAAWRQDFHQNPELLYDVHRTAARVAELLNEFGLHNVPGIPVGRFAIRQGAMMAATDEFTINISGVGGHAAMPHLAIDPILVATQLTNALQSLVSRNIDPIQSAVLSVTQIHAGEAFNVIPSTATLNGTARTPRCLYISGQW